MSDKVKGSTVALENDCSQDDAEDIKAAIRMIRGVLTAEPISTRPSDDFIVKTRVKSDLLDQILTIFRSTTC
jgi:hypothetical protein